MALATLYFLLTKNKIWRCAIIADLMINEQIRDKEVRLLSQDGEQLGIFSIKEAQAMSLAQNLDLVKISPNANPPVCKIMDYSKYRFEQQKKLKEARKKTKAAALKGTRLTPNIDKHDFNFKAKNVISFLKAGDKVKVSMRFRGREVVHAASAQKIFLDFFEACKEYCTIDKPPKMEGRSMEMILAPLKENKSN